MSPSDFTFKLTVPHEPEGASVVAAVATHAVEYSKMDKAAGAKFVEKVTAFASTALKGSTGTGCLVAFSAADGQLTVTIGTESVSHPIPS